MTRLATLLLATAAACGDGAPMADAGAGPVDGSPAHDGSPVADANGAGDAAADPDAPPGLPDAAAPPPDAAPPPPDAGWMSADHVHIYIDNFCNTSAVPAEFFVPAGETLQLTWHNHSVDYDADVWLSYGGGYLGLVTGGTWVDMFEFCSTPLPYEAAGDVSIAGGPSGGCPGFTVQIHCL